MKRKKGVLLLALLLTVLLILFVRQAGVFYAHKRLNDALLDAVQKNDTALVTALLDRGADPNTVGYYMPVDRFLNRHTGLTVLAIATNHRNLAMVRALLKKGARGQTGNNFPSYLTLIWAAQNGYTDVMNQLLDTGMPIDFPDAFGDTALMFAIESNQYQSVQLLLKRGADVNVNARSPSVLGWKPEQIIGHTALRIAVLQGKKQFVALLLQKGADYNTKVAGKTLLQEAREQHHPEIVALLEQAGEKE